MTTDVDIDVARVLVDLLRTQVHCEPVAGQQHLMPVLNGEEQESVVKKIFKLLNVEHKFQ